jgi:hypothetical protein
MRRILFVFVVLLGVLAGCQTGYCAEDSPERRVRLFYQWYLTADFAETHPVNTSTIYDHVAPCTVQMCRERLERGMLEADYFLDAQDTGDNWAEAITVSPPIAINPTTCLVAVSFDRNGPTAHHLAVFLDKSDKGWRIMKVQGLNNQ